jgi:hypothetical protein
MATNTPPNDDNNIRKGNPDPTPPPPSAINPTPNTSQTLDEFYKQFKELNKMLEKSTEALEKQSKLDKEATFAKMAADRAQKKLIETTAELEKEMAKYRDENGEFLETAEKQKKKYESTIAGLKKASDTAEENFKKASDAAAENSKGITTEVDERKKSLESLRELQGKLSGLDEELQGDLKKDLKTVSSAVEKQVKAVERSENKRQSMLDAAAQRKVDREAAAAASGEAAAAQEEKEKIDAKWNAAKKRKREFEEEQKSEELKKRLLVSGGIVGLTDIQSKLSEIMERKILQFQIDNPRASDDQIAAFQEEALKTVKNTEVLSELQKELVVNIARAEKEQVEKIMKEQRVSEETARILMGKDKVFQESLKQETKNHEETINAVKSLQESQLQELYFLQEKDAKDAEKLVEAENTVPRWAALMIDAQKRYGDLLKWSSIKNDGFFKTVLFLLAIVIGAAIGYIWTYIKTIWTAISTIAYIIKQIPSAFGGLSASMMKILGAFNFSGKFSGIFTQISNAFKPVMNVLNPLIRSIRAIVGTSSNILSFFTKFGTAFTFGFRILGKFFFYIGLAFDVIMGAYKGFKELGNTKGIILGVVAGLVKFFSFGLFDFKKTFDFLKNTLGKLIDIIDDLMSPFVELGKKLTKNFDDFNAKVGEIWSGNDSMFSKIGKTIMHAIVLWFKNMIQTLAAQFKFILGVVVKLPIYIIKGVILLVKGITEGLRSLVDWLKSSDGREGIKTFMSDLWEELKILFQESLQISEELREFIMNEAIELVEAIFDLIIEAIKASIDGIIGGLASLVGLGESSGDAAVDGVLREREFNNYRTKELIMRDTSSSIVKPVGIMANGIPVYSSSQKASSLLTASSAASSAQQSLAITPGTVVINSPTTNNVANGGGSNPTIVPQNTRNTEIAKYYNPYGGSPMGGF